MTWSEPAYETVARLVSARTGLTFPPHRRESAEAGIRRAMKRAGAFHPARYCELLRHDDTLDDLVGELTVGETYFFREPAQFDFIRKEVLPEICRRRGPDHEIRIWSAGCASGEEPYSLAILCAREGLAGRVRLLGTDISRAALARAQEGIFGAWSLRGDGAAVVQPFLTPVGKRYRLSPAIRQAVRFDHLNLALEGYPSPVGRIWAMDLILCRNVLIYFDPDTITGVGRRLFESLAEGGWLITASSDPPLGGLAPFETVTKEEGVFYRRPGITGWPKEAGIGAMGATDPLTSPPPQAADSPSMEMLVNPKLPLASADAHPEYDPARDRHGEVVAIIMQIRALANRDPAEAERVCAATVTRHPLAPEIHYWHALVLLDQGRDAEAEAALRRVLYLDRSLAVAQMTLGAVLQRRGDRTGAWRAYRNARDLCRQRRADELVPLTDGECFGALLQGAEGHLVLLGTPR
jgi:chemotaxis protein methyltransferase CheR